MNSTAQFLREADAAKWLSISRKTLANWRVLRQGPPFYKIGKAVRYRIEDLEAYITTSKKDCLD